MHIIIEIFVVLGLLIGTWIVVYPQTQSFKNTLEELNRVSLHLLRKAKQKKEPLQNTLDRQAYYRSKSSQHML